MHTHVKIEARFHFIDAWEGESAYLKLDGNIVWAESHRWCDKLITTICQPRSSEDKESTALTIDVCGHPDFPDRLSVPIVSSISHNEDTIKVSFGSNLDLSDKNRDAVSWGVDDVRIYVL